MFPAEGSTPLLMGSRVGDIPCSSAFYSELPFSACMSRECGSGWRQSGSLRRRSALCSDMACKPFSVIEDTIEGVCLADNSSSLLDQERQTRRCRGSSAGTAISGEYGLDGQPRRLRGIDGTRKTVYDLR